MLTGCTNPCKPVADPGHQIRGGGGGGGGGRPDSDIRGRVVSKIFLRPLGPHFGLKIRGAGPFLRSATADQELLNRNVSKSSRIC